MADDTTPPATGDDTETNGPPATGDTEQTPSGDTLGDAGKKALDAERKARREAETKLKDAAARLKEIEDRDKTEAQRAAEKAAEAEQRATEAEAKALRYEVAVEEGVPKHLHRFLTGTSREELAEQAAALLEALPNGDDEQAAGLSRRPQQRLRPGAIPSSDPEPPDMNRLIRRAAGR